MSRERTVRPMTSPKTASIRWPGMSFEVTISMPRAYPPLPPFCPLFALGRHCRIHRKVKAGKQLSLLGQVQTGDARGAAFPGRTISFKRRHRAADPGDSRCHAQRESRSASGRRPWHWAPGSESPGWPPPPRRRAPTPTPSSSAPGNNFADGYGMRGGRRGHGGAEFGARATELAAKLGVDEAKVTDALKTFREANKPATPPAPRAEAGPRRNGEGPGRVPGEVARHR